MPNVYFDFETQSALSLHKYGAQIYARHPSTRIMTAVFRHEDGTQVVWAPACPFKLPNVTPDKPAIMQVTSWVEADCTFIAHNCEMFDALIWRANMPKSVGVPRFRDTIHQARQCGLPGSLDKLMQCLLSRAKGDNSAMLVLMNDSYPSGSTKPLYPHGNATIWQKLVTYNIADVADLQQMSEIMERINDDIPGLVDLHWRINRRGLYIDREFTQSLINRFGELAANAGRESSTVTDGALDADSLRSPAKVKKYLATIGIALPGNSLNKAVIDLIIKSPWDFFEDDDDGKRALAIIIARKDVCRAAVGKLNRALLEMDENDRVTSWANYHKAHTGRFAGRGLQPHNFPRIKCDWQDVSSITDGNLLSGLTRSIIRPTPGTRFLIGDYSAIEARGVAYLSGCTPLLDVFRRKIDPYCHTASILFDRPITKDDELERQVGKVIVLGCGYQMGPDRFEDYCKANNVSLSAANVSPKEGVDLYRKAYPEVVSFWYDSQRAVLAAVQHNRTSYVGRCKFHCRHEALHITLPSGRALVYQDARVFDGKFGPQVEYRTSFGYFKQLYGGMIVENITQAFCRDVLCDGMLRVDVIAPVVLHVHDEIICETPIADALHMRHTVETMLNKAPEWASQIPMKIEVFQSDVYSKVPVLLS